MRITCLILFCLFCFFKQKTAYEMRISDWSSDVCSSDLYPRDMGLRPDARSAYPVRPGIAPRRQQETSMSLSTRKLGHQGLEVPTLGLGCMGDRKSVV